MITEEEIALLRREMADLRERVARLERAPVSVPSVWPIAHPQPQMPSMQLTICGCAPGYEANCPSSSCPRRHPVTLTLCGDSRTTTGIPICG